MCADNSFSNFSFSSSASSRERLSALNSSPSAVKPPFSSANLLDASLARRKSSKAPCNCTRSSDSLAAKRLALFSACFANEAVDAALFSASSTRSRKSLDSSMISRIRRCCSMTTDSECASDFAKFLAAFRVCDSESFVFFALALLSGLIFSSSFESCALVALTASNRFVNRSLSSLSASTRSFKSFNRLESSSFVIEKSYSFARVDANKPSSSSARFDSNFARKLNRSRSCEESSNLLRNVRNSDSTSACCLRYLSF
mmetsp:Transcript_2283/g.6982  ORF Transcript_2283/g.6982 Transcript_2283/m.6982 type:complete len:258 (-) Transcript_2283:446-1219(-)